MSYDTLQAICRAVSIPVVAIGGISRDNVHRLSGSGICGVAVIKMCIRDRPCAIRIKRAGAC